ncbi:hypothetical protein VTN00DRAFT_1138 [Thermoascus crustaceus]|uniref:uncharacterized protein n=1 Tax=Thermoascus crustaceus TaxID=5088 RepID=UPI0037424FCB
MLHICIRQLICPTRHGRPGFCPRIQVSPPVCFLPIFDIFNIINGSSFLRFRRQQMKPGPIFSPLIHGCHRPSARLHECPSWTDQQVTVEVEGTCTC